MNRIHIDGPWFKDQHGRTLLLRGVNLGGSSKVPYTPNGATYLATDFFDHKNISFVGRPFPLEEADRHFERLKSWGLDLVRLLVPWEAIEHAGPGQYDEAYLDYLTAVVEKARDHGINLFIDPHQDVWSRFSGGDGAPGWTFDLIGMDITRFKGTGAAIAHQTYGDPFPQMIWSSNYNKLAAATMFSLFFGGNDFAPETQVNGVPIQDYLQAHYINAYKQVAERLKGMDHVLGFDTMNEPSPGFIGDPDIRTSDHQLRMGDVPTPYQTMLLGAGFSQSVAVYNLTLLGVLFRGTRVIPAEGYSVYCEGYQDVWQQNGVWDTDSRGLPHLLRPHHFGFRPDGNPAHFAQDYLRPFVNAFAHGIREIDPEATIFLEADPVLQHEPPMWTDDDIPNIVYVPHWYDGVLLFTKRYLPHVGFNAFISRPVIGKNNLTKSFAKQLGLHQLWAKNYLGNPPVLIGETGIPFDLDDNIGYKTGNFSLHVQAMDRTMRALEANLLHYTLWNYTSDNTNARGDLWNGEDLSIFSQDQQLDPSDINSGGRALEAVVRPYAKATAGEPLRISFDVNRVIFEYAFRHDSRVTEPTEFFIPRYHYPFGYHVDVSDGEYEKDLENQRLIYRHSGKDVPHFVRVRPLNPRHEPDENAFWRNRLMIVGAVVLALMALLSGRKKKDNA
ncbi:cellulase family glycosylhydrolase [Phototrophicus methaneseepsis]|uniref:Cellulase family glycosylhydrolase n=1 Tax=Phototrophicus methaneseepsis TaxID=2710758 RepID=A0A7S8E9H4_9CHLR|nr:cellulase family glycosylhydrolase [Phototrophicus methaneseepsis]QPC82820.1 cellulase family glycosylhydrolase [Phototrophicus methaneseepsis]